MLAKSTSHFVSIARFFTPALATLVTACSSGTTAEPGSSSSSGTVGDQCQTIGTAFCQHVFDDCLANSSDGGALTLGDECNTVAQALCTSTPSCIMETPTDQCVQQDMDLCCGNANRCGDLVTSTEGDAQACASAIAASPCSYSADSLPPECKPLVQSAAASSLADCQAQVQQGCCEDKGTCAMAATSSSAAVHGCVQALGGLACDDLTPPAVCQGVITTADSPSASPRLRTESWSPATGVRAAGRQVTAR